MDNKIEFDRQAELIKKFRETLNWDVLARQLLKKL